MKNYRKTLLIAVLIGAVAAAVTYETTPDIPESCRTFREQVKQLALSDYTLAGVIVNVPERQLDDAAQQRFAGMTADQCTAALPAVTTDPDAFAHTTWAGLMRQAGDASAVAIAQCRDKRINGELKNHADSAECSNAQITAAFTQIHYPYMDLVKKLTDSRLEEAQKLDKSLMATTEDQSVFARLALEVTEEERKRIAAQKKP